MGGVLLTGASGFLGRTLMTQLRAAGVEVAGLTSGAGYDHVFHCDIQAEDQVRDIVNAVQPDVVIHAAALSSVTANEPAKYYLTNVIGTEHLLNALNGLGKRTRFMMISTAGVYGNHPVEVLTEDLPPQPVHHYGLSKFAAERLTQNYGDTLDWTIVRPFNVIGPAQTRTFIVPKLCMAFASKQSQVRLGNLDVYRDYIDVDSACEIMIRLLDKPEARGQVLNLCTGTGTSLRELIACLEELAGYSIEVVNAPEFTRKSEVWRLLGSAQKLESVLGGPVPSRPLKSVLYELLDAYRSELE